MPPAARLFRPILASSRQVGLMLAAAFFASLERIRHENQRVGACGDDAQIEASIKDSFQRLPYLGAPNSIQVQTSKHVVYLSGEVSAGLMSRTAAEIAHGTPSVERVVNTISVTK